MVYHSTDFFLIEFLLCFVLREHPRSLIQLRVQARLFGIWFAYSIMEDQWAIRHESYSDCALLFGYI